MNDTDANRGRQRNRWLRGAGQGTPIRERDTEIRTGTGVLIHPGRGPPRTSKVFEIGEVKFFAKLQRSKTRGDRWPMAVSSVIIVISRQCAPEPPAQTPFTVELTTNRLSLMNSTQTNFCDEYQHTRYRSVS